MTQDPLLAANSNLQALIQQVGILSEGMTEIKLMLREQADIAREQNQSIARLADLQETTVREQVAAFREQTAIVAAQTANVAQLISLLDRGR
jgi:methyl-accepting chemotaxis protein